MHLVFAFVAGSGSVAGSFATSESAAGSGVDSHFVILSKFVIVISLLSKLLRTFSLALNNNH